MLNQQDTGSDNILAPLLTCTQILISLWQRADGEDGQKSILFEEWIQEVSNWAKLAEWKADFKQKLRYGNNLWLPNGNAQELGILHGIAVLADGLGYTAIQLAKAILELRLSGLEHSSQAENSRDSITTVNQLQTGSAPIAKVNQEKAALLPLATDNAVDYQPLIEALNSWQAMFELALDEAAVCLDREHFPAEDLSASLSEMCELLRGVLTNKNWWGTPRRERPNE